MSVLNFTCNNCGEHSKPNFGVATAPGEMFPPYSISINGNKDLSNCIVWNDKGRVYNIHIIHNVGISYTVVVDGEGPDGVFAGCGYLRFFDYSGDHYDLSLCLHARREHTVEYMSLRPGISAIEWRDESF